MKNSQQKRSGDSVPLLKEPPVWLWWEDYYDGPLSGVGLMPDGSPVWISVNDIQSKYYDYHVRQLTPEQFQLALSWHAVFRVNVSTGAEGEAVTRPDEGISRNHGSRASRDYFYSDECQQRRPKKDICNGPVIGRFRA